jgi:hypothetical protein
MSGIVFRGGRSVAGTIVLDELIDEIETFAPARLR